MRRELDKELADAGLRSGQNLVWSAQEEAILGLILDEIDRKAVILNAWEEATDPKVVCKLSAEARLLEQSIARLLKSVKTDLPARESNKTMRARRAANTRWDRDAAG
ncbi:hypothetical protein [Mycolicibacterium sp. XJ1904]